MEFQIDITYKNGGKDVAKAFNKSDLLEWFLDADMSEIESVTVKEWV